MTTATALRNLKLAKARKRKAESTEKGKWNDATNKKSNLKRRNTNTPKPTKAPDASIQSPSHTVDLSNVHGGDGLHRNNKVFYTIKLSSKGGSEPLKVLQSTLREWLRTMQSCISSIVLFDTSPNGQLAITKPDQISTNLQSLKNFFNGIRPRTGLGDIWFTILLGFNEDEEELLENTRWWFQENKCVMYRKPLQVLNTSRELWLL